MTDENIPIELTKQLASIMIEKHIMLASAESCTGGWLAKFCTDIAGSSAWFDRGFITYSNDSKQQQLGVSAETLSTFGAVSEQTAKQMALGVLNHSAADIGIAITGIAGPSGATEQKPVGTVYIAWANSNTTACMHYQFDGDREAVRLQSVIAALQGLIKLAAETLNMKV